MEIQDILTLIQALDDHSLTELKLDSGDVKLTLKREEKAPQILNVTGTGIPVQGDMMAQHAMLQQNGMPLQTLMPGTAPIPETAGATGAAPVNSGTPGEIPSDNVISSPLVGTFYNAASPEAEPFVKVGDTVKKGQVLGIIEAMKLMNEIECEFDGIIEAIMVGNEELVEYGQPLFRIR